MVSECTEIGAYNPNFTLETKKWLICVDVYIQTLYIIEVKICFPGIGRKQM